MERSGTAIGGTRGHRTPDQEQDDRVLEILAGVAEHGEEALDVDLARLFVRHRDEPQTIAEELLREA